MPYLLDANVFIQASQRYYGLDFCPGFWDWLVQANTAGRVFSIEKVRVELEVGTDKLVQWVARRDARFFLKPDTKVMTALGAVATWVTGQNFEPSAISTFLQVADYYRVGHALARGFTVVTEELPASSPRKVKIPNACVGVGV